MLAYDHFKEEGKYLQKTVSVYQLKYASFFSTFQCPKLDNKTNVLRNLSTKRKKKKKKYSHKVKAMCLVMWLRFADDVPKELIVQLSESLITIKCGHC